MATSQYASKVTIIHLDIGSVFKPKRNRNIVKQAGLVQSIVNTGLLFANQVIESFLKRLKPNQFTFVHGSPMKKSIKQLLDYCESFGDYIQPQMVLHRTPMEEFHRLTTPTFA